MYKLSKPHGAWSVVTISNTETNSSTQLGALTTKMIDIINASGCLSEPIDAHAEWDVVVDKATAQKLCLLALPSNKPKRNQSKKVISQPSEQSSEEKQEVVDAMTIMLRRKNS